MFSNLEPRTILRPDLAVVIDRGGGNIRMPQPLLHLGDVRPFSNALVARITCI
ncbi:MAG TPA: hypothetical protein VFS89_05985 [Nitrosospira sp.]|nr:hypothetical protein [Nitrosospira sp.]